MRVPCDIVAAGGPYIVFAAGNPSGWATNPENYWYAVYSGGSWTVNLIDNAGAIPSTSLYEGGLALDPMDPTIAYLAKSDGTNYQLWKYQTSDGGSSWTATQLTYDSGDFQNYHPTRPLNASGAVRTVWSAGGAPPEKNPFGVQIRAYPNPHAPF